MIDDQIIHSEMTVIQSLIKQSNFRAALKKVFDFIIESEFISDQLRALIPLLIKKINEDNIPPEDNTTQANIASQIFFRTLAERSIEAGDYDNLIYSAKILGLMDETDQDFIAALNTAYRANLFVIVQQILLFVIGMGFRTTARLIMLAETFAHLDQQHKAKEIFKELTKDPDLHVARLKYCEILVEEGNFQEAKTVLEKEYYHGGALENRFSYLSAVIERAHFQYDAAKKEIRKLLERDPNNSDALNLYCTTLYDLNDIETAISTYERYLESPNTSHEAVAYNNLGVMYMASGKLEDSIYCFQRACEINKEYASAHKNLAFVAPATVNKDNLNNLSQKLTNQSDTIDLKIAYFYLKRSESDYKAAFNYLTQANSALKAAYSYDFKNDKALFDRVRSPEQHLFDCSPYTIQPVRALPTPIFIVGLPRSGTSLIAQILSVDENITNLGELPYLNYLLFDELKKERASEKDLRYIRSEYYRLVRNHANTQTKFFIDKTPLNFFWINWIKCLFPDAIIINMERDKRDLYWSNYSHFFTGERNLFSSDFSDIDQFHKEYQRLLNENLDKVISVSLDEMKVNLRGSITPVLSALKLNWTDNFHNFHRNKSAVKTASAMQVRSNIMQDKMPDWVKYIEFLPKNIFN